MKLFNLFYGIVMLVLAILAGFLVPYTVIAWDCFKVILFVLTIGGGIGIGIYFISLGVKR